MVSPTMLLACFAAVSILGRSSADDGANFQVVVPDALINAEVEKFIPELVKKIDAFPLPTCCYDDVGEAHVHLNMQSMKASAAKLSLKVASSTAGITVAGGVTLLTQGSYRLCLHDDPFSKHACSELFGCKGNFQIDPNITFSMIARVVGENVSIVSPVVKVNSIANNFCSKIRDEIGKNVAKIEEGGAKALAAYGPKLSAMIKELLKNKSATIEGYRSEVVLLPGTTSFTGGFTVRGHVSFVNIKTGTASPWVSHYPLPEATAVEGGDVIVYIADSLLNNGIYPIFKSGILHFAINKTYHLTKYHVELNVTGHGPSVSLNATDQIVVVPVLVRATAGNKTISGSAVFHAGFKVSIDVSNKTSVVLHLDLSEDIGVSNFSANCSTDCEGLLTDLVKDAKLAIPLINAILHNKTPIFELPKGVALTSASLTFGKGYMKLSVLPSLSDSPTGHHDDRGTSIQPRSWRLNRQFGIMQHLRKLRSAGGSSDLSLGHGLLSRLMGNFAIACPTIPGARQDGCI